MGFASSFPVDRLVVRMGTLARSEDCLNDITAIAYPTAIARGLRFFGYCGLAFFILCAQILIVPRLVGGLAHQFWLCDAVRQGGAPMRGFFELPFLLPGVALLLAGLWAVLLESRASVALKKAYEHAYGRVTHTAPSPRLILWASALWATAFGVRWLGSFKCPSMIDIIFPPSVIEHLVKEHGLRPSTSGLAASSLWITSFAAIVANALLARSSLIGLREGSPAGPCLVAIGAQALLITAHLMGEACGVLYR